MFMSYVYPVLLIFFVWFWFDVYVFGLPFGLLFGY
jgi:hypothetical protein